MRGQDYYKRLGRKEVINKFEAEIIDSPDEISKFVRRVIDELEADKK